MEALIPAMDLAARDEARNRFAGTYTHEESRSRLTLTLDDGLGLVLSDWVVRDLEVLPNLDRYNPARVNDTTRSDLAGIRMYPTGLETDYRSAWRTTFPAFTDEVAEIVDGITSLRDVTCITWQMTDPMIYNYLSMDNFEFRLGGDGETAVSIKSKAFDVEIARGFNESEGYKTKPGWFAQ